MGEPVEFVPFTRVTGAERVYISAALNMARNTVTNELATELPYVDKVYQSPIKAYRRIGHVASQMHLHKIDAYVIRRDRIVQGIATRVPSILPAEVASSNPAELSYWIRRQKSSSQAVELGNQALEFLMFDYKDTDCTHWTVTLLDDAVKEEACIKSGMQPIGYPNRYDIDDGVTSPRQLWASFS